MESPQSDVVHVTASSSDATPKAETPKVTRKPKSSEVTFSSVIAAYAKSRNIDTTRAGKAIRSKIRAMGQAEVTKKWPAFKKSQKALRDGNRYPTSMPRAFAEELLKGRNAK
jgi:hypothetical protein